MALTGKKGQQIILFSLIALIVPMLLFPNRLGTDLATVALINVLFEIVYYGVVIWAFYRHVTLIKLIQAASVCLVYRLALGAVTGLLLAGAYSMDVQVSLTLAMSIYLPALLFQIAISPFALKSLLSQICVEAPRRVVISSAIEDAARQAHEQAADKRMSSESSSFLGDGDHRPSSRHVPEAPPMVYGDVNGFEKAVRYLGELTSVRLACVVDHEGLLLANFVRGGFSPDEVAPLALVLWGQAQPIISRSRLEDLEKIDATLHDHRLTVARAGSVFIVSVADRQSEDSLSIRLTQSVEIVRKYMSERYAVKASPNAENMYVSSAQ